MTMQLVYGSYQHAANSVSITSFTRQTILGDTGFPKLLRVNAAFKAKLIGANTGDVMGQAFAMQQAYSIGGQSLAMVSDYGNTVWTMDSASSVGGVMVTQPVSYGNVRGAEGGTYLYCNFALQADYLVARGGDVMRFSESLSFSNLDGGPTQIVRVPAVGRPILQNVTETSVFYATQMGELWAAGQQPEPMAPIFDGFQLRQDGAQRVTYLSPRTIRGVAYEYGVQWQYNFVSGEPLIGLPNIR